MTTIDAHEAGAQLSPLLDSVERGEEVLITRQGNPVAKLVGVGAADRHAHVAKFMADAEALRERVAAWQRENGQPPFTTEEILDLIRAGRR